MMRDVFSYFIAIAASFASMFAIFRIVLRTEKQLRWGFVLLSVASLFFTAFLVFRAVEFAGFIDFAAVSDILLIIFAVVSAVSYWFMGAVVTGITDRGQMLFVISGKDYVRRLVDSVMDLRGSVFYVSLTEPWERSEAILSHAGVNLKRFHFVGLSGGIDMIENGRYEKAASIIPSFKRLSTFRLSFFQRDIGPDVDGPLQSGVVNRLRLRRNGMKSEVIPDSKKLAVHILRMIGENNFDFLVVDDLSSLKFEPVELERWVGQVTAKARESRTQSLLFVNKDSTPPDVIKDLGMFMDKVIV